MHYRIGSGLDFHRLVLDVERPLVLGGHTVPGELALEGHSDADLILHALADAILGALAQGDIGDLFPDTDPAYKNMDSSIIIEKSLELMRSANLELANVDLTVIGETPRIKPHRQAIRERLSQLLGLPITDISLKATTTEKMGALGRKEGLGCLAQVLLGGKEGLQSIEGNSRESRDGQGPPTPSATTDTGTKQPEPTAVSPGHSDTNSDSGFLSHVNPLWEDTGQALSRTFVFEDFDQAFAFLTRVAALAREHNHHPDWNQSYNRVHIQLSTHSVGRVTERDFALARAIDALPDLD